MKHNTHFKFIIVALLFILGCKKVELVDNTLQKTKKKNVPPVGFFIENRSVPGTVAENMNSNSTFGIGTATSTLDLNNGEDSIILGQHLNNPYSLANMQLAVNTLYGGNYPIAANYLYVRFKPSSTEQLMTLDETEGLELQDYPMDYEVLQDGDYYQDPTQSPEDFQWLYTVVPINYNFPQGIQMEIIEQLFLPEDNEILEDMAESIALGAQYQSFSNNNGTSTQLSSITIQRLDTKVADFQFQPDPCYCDPTNLCLVNPQCDGGGGGGGTPPEGGIFVEEQTVCGSATRILPLRQVNVVAKRWFKFWRGYTDDNGHFTVTKNFKNKVKVIVKTQNSNARVSKVRGIRLWQMLFACRKRVGVFNGSYLPSVRYVFTKPTDGDAHNKDLAYWAAATTHNSIVEFKQYTTEFGLPLPPDNLHVMVTNWSFMHDAGATPMWNKCHSNETPDKLAEFYVASSNYIAAGAILLANTLKNQMDVIIGYKTNGSYNCTLTSSGLRSTVYHELGHTQHFVQAGCNFWTAYRNAITLELTKLDQVNFHPYGTGVDTRSAPIIATGEMWGYFCEKWYTERHYGDGGAVAANFFAREQGSQYYNNAVFGLNANFSAIESFNPNLGSDIRRWIPQGLPYDLIDSRNDGFPVIDDVNGFTINQCFNALQPDVVSIPAFRDRLLFQNSNAQQAQVNQLFYAYNY